MSSVYSCDIFCDRCSDWIHGSTGHEASGLATKAVKVAKAAGWSRHTKSQFIDLCPKCLDEARKEELNAPET